MGRVLVTANIRDLVPLDGRYRAAGQSHAGLILVSTKTFPQNRGFPSAITASLATLLSGTGRTELSSVPSRNIRAVRSWASSGLSRASEW